MIKSNLKPLRMQGLKPTISDQSKGHNVIVIHQRLQLLSSPLPLPSLPFSSKQSEETNILNVFNTLVTPQNILKVSNLWTDYDTKVELKYLVERF